MTHPMSNKPPVIKLSLIPILEEVDDDFKLECIEAIIGTIMQKGLIEKIRKLVNDPGYDD